MLKMPKNYLIIVAVVVILGAWYLGFKKKRFCRYPYGRD